jgi:hypothetical protein
MESKPKQELLRVAFYEGILSLDTTGRAKGRGVYLCRNNVCIEKAQKRKAFSRSFSANIAQSEIDRVCEELKEVNGQANE